MVCISGGSYVCLYTCIDLYTFDTELHWHGSNKIKLSCTGSMLTETPNLRTIDIKHVGITAITALIEPKIVSVY